ncbi:alpha/beta hydrolase [Sciscionella sediminilitoris]|uniref:alpha/beta hydrolase n=1 Tax=Sciscionella sediminilitoris TaxID=1445613 RepID=UPI00068F50F5|nr:alpha/beta hydrolase-fold protein [Sciscionella sp. SE31]
MNRPISRRGLLLGGAGAVAAVAGFTIAEPDAEPSTPNRKPRPVEYTPVTVERVRSAARGRTVHLAITRPSGVNPERLPVCLLLHGLHGNARGILPRLAPRMAASMNGGALTPFVFAALDGGDNYWHHARPTDDPMRMLLDEAPVWLAERGFQRTPFAAAGVSMGGFGALLYARRRAERADPVRAVAAISPGLLLSWTLMRKRHAFSGAPQWADLDPLRHVDALRGIPTGIWCGTSDPFISGAQRFIAAAHPEFIHLAPGRHNARFWSSCVPSLLDFLGKYAPVYGADRPGGNPI